MSKNPMDLHAQLEVRWDKKLIHALDGLNIVRLKI